MKKIIALALSVLVGAFGYTIVDSAIENRVASLESQVAELQDYHTSYSDRNSTDATTNPAIGVGYKSHWSLDDSAVKYLIRVYDDNTIMAFTPYDLNNLIQYSLTQNTIDSSDPLNCETTTHIPEKLVDKEVIEEYYLYITDAYSEIVSVIDNGKTTFIGFDKDFSTKTYTEKNAYSYTYKVVISGYTDKALSGRMINKIDCYKGLSFRFNGEGRIREDGSFEFVSEERNGFWPNFSINDIYVY